VVLQHGSILLGRGHERLADILNLNSDAEREQIRTTICERSASLGELLGRTVSFEKCTEAILRTLKD
jgi:lipoate-protein ligase A